MSDFESIEKRFRDGIGKHPGIIEFRFHDQFQKERGCSGLEPVIVELAAFFKKIGQGNGIVNGFGIFFEPETVIPFFDFSEKIPMGMQLRLFRRFDLVPEIGFEFSLSISQHSRIPGIHRDIGEIVQIGEQ